MARNTLAIVIAGTLIALVGYGVLRSMRAASTPPSSPPSAPGPAEPESTSVVPVAHPGSNPAPGTEPPGLPAKVPGDTVIDDDPNDDDPNDDDPNDDDPNDADPAEEALRGDAPPATPFIDLDELRDVPVGLDASQLADRWLVFSADGTQVGVFAITRAGGRSALDPEDEALVEEMAATSIEEHRLRTEGLPELSRQGVGLVASTPEEAQEYIQQEQARQRAEGSQVIGVLQAPDGCWIPADRYREYPGVAENAADLRRLTRELQDRYENAAPGITWYDLP